MTIDRELPTRRLVEVWGDTADTTHLAWSIVLGVGISVPAFLLANRGLATWGSSPELAKAYAMLAGLAGCVLAGLICALLFKPKRTVVEGPQVDLGGRLEVLTQLAAQHGGLGSVADLPPAVIREMQALEIYELFHDFEATQVATRLPNPTPATHSPVPDRRTLAASVQGA